MRESDHNFVEKIFLFYRMYLQAHWAGLFPDKTIADFDRSGYKRFARSYLYFLFHYYKIVCKSMYN